MISDTHRFIYIHVPKTGGTSIEKVFEQTAEEKDVGGKHFPAVIYNEAYPEKFRNYFKFSFVRNPWDWLVSRYHWSKDRQGIINYSFSEMIERLSTGTPLSMTARWLQGSMKSQISRLVVGDEIAVDFVGRYETLQSDFETVCAKLSINKVKLPHVFKTDHAHYSTYYDERTCELVRNTYADDIDAFGYAFGSPDDM